MPKNEIHGYLRTAIILAGIIFAGGGYAMKVNANSNRIEVNASDIKDNRSAIHKEELARTKMVGKIDATREDVSDIKDDFKELKQYLMEYDFNKKGK